MKLKIKDPGSALTHFIAMMLALFASSPLLIKAARTPGYAHVLALTIFITSMILLYAASTIYHTLDISPKINQILRKMDHMMIFILIAGTYTPVCMLVLGDKTGWFLLALVWSIALIGMIINALWITCPKWFSSLIYIAMGWICVLAFGKIISEHTKSALSHHSRHNDHFTWHRLLHPLFPCAERELRICHHADDEYGERILFFCIF